MEIQFEREYAKSSSYYISSRIHGYKKDVYKRQDKGSVFKIDDYSLDGNGHLTLNYEILYDESMASADKSIVIYYAKEEYILSLIHI